MSLRARLSRDEGFTVVELLIASALFVTVMSLVGGFIVSSMRAGRFTEQETASIDDARIAQAQILKDVRGAVGVDTGTNAPCTSNGAPAGYCLLVYNQLPGSGTTEQVRYRAVQTGGAGGPTTLYRDTGCDPSFTCTNPSALATNLDNRARNVVMFSCDLTNTYPQISLTMVVSPLSAEQASSALTIQTRGRPRNIGGNQC